MIGYAIYELLLHVANCLILYSCRWNEVQKFIFETSRNGRLKVYDNIYDDFCRQMRTPCVIFTGHPSLRIGNAVHFLEMWGNDSKNALIMTG